MGARRNRAESGRNEAAGHENETLGGRTHEEEGRRVVLRGWLQRSLSFSLPSFLMHARTHARVYSQ